MQQTYFNINPQLLENALKITGLKNQDEVINFALGQLLQSTKQKKLVGVGRESRMGMTTWSNCGQEEAF